ncbi:MAG TPA: UMP kinase [Nitrososphaerales archaeon]|nr:UMP kinase [Nitrososphaerales archaeon]
MKIVLRIGGSVLGSPPNPALLEEYSGVVLELTSTGNSLAVIVGGGPISREYIKSANELHLSPFQQDTIAIYASRLNAKLVAMKLGGVSSIPTSTESLVQRLSRNKVAVMGGLKPGITTDTVAAMVAKQWGADVVIKGSDQEGIYTSDPRTDKRAKKLSRISHQRMESLLGGEHRPGIHSIIDPVAVHYMAESGVKIVVLNGRRPRNIIRAVRGENVGTVVS